MKTLALALLLLATGDSLVDAAKTAKANRKKSTAKVITNADVKKSRGKLGQTTVPAPPDAPPEESLVEKQATMRKQRAERAEKLAAATASVEALEKEVALLEQQYYEENDLDHRDGELVRRFNEAKKQLDAARETLAKLDP